MPRSRRNSEPEDIVDHDENTKGIWLAVFLGIFVYACAMGAWLFLREKGESIQDTNTEERRGSDGGVADASSGGDDEPAALSVDVSTDPWDYVPDEAHGVGFLDVKKLARGGMISKVLKMAEGKEKEGEKSFEEKLTDLGIDPEKDVDSLVLVFQEGGASAESEQGGMIVSGRFETDAIMKFAKQENPGSVRADIGGIPAMKIKVESKNDGFGGRGSSKKKEDGMMAILNDRVVLGGTEDFVRRAIDIHKGKSEALNKSRSEIVSKAKKFARRTLWVSSKVPPKEKKKDNPNSVKMSIGPDMSVVKHVIVGADFEEGGFELDARMECGSEEEAGKLQTDMQSGVMMLTGMVGMFAQGDPDASKIAMEIAQAIVLGAEGDETTLSFKLTEGLISRIEDAVERVAEKQAKGMLEGGGSFE
jgi:hypothetical protein